MRFMGLMIAIAALGVTSQAYSPPPNMATGPDPNVDIQYNALGLNEPEAAAGSGPLCPPDATGDCCEANPGSGGCGDPECCELVCNNFSPLCCTDDPLGWIQQCADAAAKLCGGLCVPCQSDADCDDGDPCNGEEICVGAPDGMCEKTPPAPDCNGNGVLDSCDIANGTSTDADADGIPDDCEVLCQSDLNNDGVVGIVDFLKLLSDWGVCP